MSINIQLLDPIAEAMTLALKTGVLISRAYDPTEKPVITFKVGAAKPFTLVQGLEAKEEVEQKFTFCCYLAGLMRNPESSPFKFYKNALEQLTGLTLSKEEWPFSKVNLMEVFHMLQLLTSVLDERPTLELEYWEEVNRRRPVLDDRTRVAHLKEIAKLKFGHLGVFEMDPADEPQALEAMSKCLEVILHEIGKEWVIISALASKANKDKEQFIKEARKHMGPEDEEQKVLDTF